jgi:hypothetical protein
MTPLTTIGPDTTLTTKGHMRSASAGWKGWRSVALLGTLLMVSLCGTVTSAQAAPVIELDSDSDASQVAPGATDFRYFVHIKNFGDAATSGQLTLRVTLPDGMVATDVANGIFDSPWDCSGNTLPNTVVTCVKTVPKGFFGDEIPPATYTGMVRVTVSVDPDASGTLTPRFELWGDGTVTRADGSACGTAPPDTPCAVGGDPTPVSSDAPAFDLSDFETRIIDAGGTPFTQAGGNPYEVSSLIRFNTFKNTAPETGGAWPVEAIRNVSADLPPGLVGAPAGIAKCDPIDLGHADGFVSKPLCDPASQVGTAIVYMPEAFRTPVHLNKAPVYNLETPPGVPARFGFQVAGEVITMDAKLRSGSDYGLTVNARNVPQGIANSGVRVSFWGVPASHAHDRERQCPNEAEIATSGPTCEAGVPPVAFLRNPTSCSAAGHGLPFSVRAESWDQPGVIKTGTFETHQLPAYPSPPSDWGPPQGITGCEDVPFDPELSAKLSTTKAGAPAGLSVDVSLPQPRTPGVIQTSDLRKAVVTLPEGTVVNPSSAHGLDACSPAQIDLDSDNTKPTCPQGSRIGTVKLDTPLLEDQLDGVVYLAKQSDNPFGSLIAIYIVVEGPGVVVKLPGKISLDQSTGRVTATFDNNPQLPFSNLSVKFFSGPKAALSNPTTCGLKTVSARLTSWSGKTVDVTSPFDISGDGNGGPCAAPQFKPTLDAGVTDPVAGSSSSFVLRVQRSDLDSQLRTIATQLPPGLLAKVAGVPLCTDAQAASATCPAASQVGRVEAGAGAGSNPFYISTGKVFLTEGYKGAPYGLDITVPAIAGPFDLGIVNVRAAIQIDPETAQVTVVADPMPHILQGIPLQVRDLRVVVDRAGFVRTPTNCDAMSVGATVGSVNGETAQLSDRFQVADCAGLAFAPRLAMRLTGRKQVRTGGHPGVTARLVQPAGQAHIKRVKVALPKSLALDPDNANDSGLLCPFEKGQAADCPASSIIGRATAVSPLLERPLRGAVYFVQGIRIDPKTGNRIRTLPRLLVKLRGEIAVNLRATSTVGGGRLVSTFPVVPDAPVSRFKLTLAGGKRKGILIVTKTPAGARQSLCAKKQTTALAYRAHNARLLEDTIQTKTPCPKRKPRQRLDLRR